MKLQVVHTSGSPTQLEVLKSVFGETPNMQLLAQAVRVYLANQRQGTAKVKTRSEVNRTKKKWYKQKGTGGARHGARTPSIFVGGGVAHGPNGTTDWSMKLTASQRQRAMVFALSKQANCMIVSDDVEKLSGKTKNAAKLFNTIAPENKHVLVILHESIAGVIRSTANLEHVLVTQASRLNVYETLLADKIVLTEAAVRMLEKRFGHEEKKVVAEKTVTKAAAPKVEVKAEAKVVKTAKPRAARTTAKKAVK
jgi:large subunit ribosomal protein L4